MAGYHERDAALQALGAFVVSWMTTQELRVPTLEDEAVRLKLVEVFPIYRKVKSGDKLVRTSLYWGAQG